MVGRVTDAGKARGHDRIVPKGAAGRVHGHFVTQVEHMSKQQLLVGECRLQLGHLDRAVTETCLAGRDAGGG